MADGFGQMFRNACELSALDRIKSDTSRPRSLQLRETIGMVRNELGIAVEQFFSTEHRLGEAELPLEDFPVSHVRFIQVHGCRRSLGGKRPVTEQYPRMFHEVAAHVVEMVPETRGMLSRRVEKETSSFEGTSRHDDKSTADGEWDTAGGSYRGGRHALLGAVCGHEFDRNGIRHQVNLIRTGHFLQRQTSEYC